VRSGNGEVVWRFDRDGKKPEQVLRPQVALDLNVIMNKVVEEGTARRAILDGVKAAGKTGTTNAYRDAWFVGYTGNFVCGVWFGNDDYAPTNRMTGGSLPAMTWRQIMAYAHQGVEIKPIPGVSGPTPAAPATASTPAAGSDPNAARIMLTRRSIDVLLRIERNMETATRALAATPPVPAGQRATVTSPGTVASSETATRGN